MNTNVDTLLAGARRHWWQRPSLWISLGVLALAAGGTWYWLGQRQDAAAETDAHAAPTRRWADHVAMVETTALRRAALATSGRPVRLS